MPDGSHYAIQDTAALERQFESIGGTCAKCAVRDAGCCALAECPFMRICPVFRRAVGRPAVAATVRRDLLRRAIDRLERAERHDRWDCSAREYMQQAAALLEDAGLPELAERCDMPFGGDVGALLRDVRRVEAPNDL